MNKRTVKYEELNAKQKENFKNMVVELTYHNGISRDNLIALIKDMAQENAELKAELRGEHDLQALIWTERNNNEYYKAYVKDWQERKGKNATIPHADGVYKDYVELKARLEKAIELPCKVGDMVYFLDAYDKTFRILEFEPIEKFEISDECEYAITECGNYFEFEYFGKYYFTSKAEAEKALKEGE